MRKPHPKTCGCAHCQAEKDFDLPELLIEKIKNEEIVLFAGAGISTENPIYCQSTLYDEIRAELKIQDTPTFPELMETYCARPEGRIKLLEKIKRRFDYFKSFDDFYWSMTRFHRAISPLFMIKDIITTNWDDFFERECGIDAFVYDSDLAFWDAARRRVIKIHGSITNFGSIVATTEDYRQSFTRLNNGPLGAHLKSLIARKTVIYTGYSLSDENYIRLLRNISKMMGDNIRQSYFVSPNIDLDKLSEAPIPLIPIETDGAYFFEEVHSRLAEEKFVVRDEAFDICEHFLRVIQDIHLKTASAYLKKRHPLLIFALSYQDGLIHAFQRIRRQRKTGEYHWQNSVHGRVHAYEHKANELLREKDYWNAAYARGYQNGLLCLLIANDKDDPPTPPAFEFPFPFKARSLSGVIRFPIKKIPTNILKVATRIHRSNPNLGIDLIPDHTPYL